MVTGSKNVLKCYIALLTLVSGVRAATYYLAPNGQDGDGRGTQSSPWKTINYAAARLQAGDVLILTDGVYYERPISISGRSGTSTSPITVRAAAGAVPIIDIGRIVTGWTLDAGSVYRGTIGSSSATVGQAEGLVVDGVPLIKVGARVDIREGNYFVSGTTIYAWTKGGASPAGKPVTLVWGGAESVSEKPPFLLNNCNYWVFEGITIQGSHQGLWATFVKENPQFR